jgi:hypothetical protein
VPDLIRRASQFFSGDRSNTRQDSSSRPSISSDAMNKLLYTPSKEIKASEARRLFKDSQPLLKERYLQGIQDLPATDNKTYGQLFDGKFKEALETQKQKQREKEFVKARTPESEALSTNLPADADKFKSSTFLKETLNNLKKDAQELRTIVSPDT